VDEIMLCQNHLSVGEMVFLRGVIVSMLLVLLAANASPAIPREAWAAALPSPSLRAPEPTTPMVGAGAVCCPAGRSGLRSTPEVSMPSTATRPARTASASTPARIATPRTPDAVAAHLTALQRLGVVERREAMAAARAEVAQEVAAKRSAAADRHAAKLARIAEIARGTAPSLATLGTGRFPVVLADPPWRFDEGVQTPSRMLAYPTMATDDIAAMPVSAVAARDAVLLLWSTAAHLEHALRVMRAWGFVYKTQMVWDKSKIGMGRWTRLQHEPLLIGVRGAFPAPFPGTQAPSVLRAPRGAHSAKPPESYALWERLWPSVPRLELFARQERRGWTTWGNQVGEVALATTTTQQIEEEVA